ncbi:hypothetical protein P170DRAFT_453076 [Aspergillus steynii IBT 23096]|uniref:Uncharacterized protein n=1 Tax=Aspergillus steynii IBT 23096 TaxID=1392250 RepID=A0A2I2GSI4_9EURO|nr:uncharacterized protein P170DRAFT_453076 [Aspergillus steynii IBT 23096]PLB55832.1 hypothetical protein P170DRAFT_453076 [Aspergillus steynii IBT 23096]
MMAPISEITSRFESPSTPRTSEQWRQALEGVKLLYIRHQYKQCAARAAEILRNTNQKIHPVHKTYLHFYSAISYEGMGRAAHQYSTTKVTLLQTALDCFITCSAVLPGLIPTQDDTDGDPSGVESTPAFHTLGNSSSIGSFVTVIRDIIDKNIDSLADDPFVSDPEPEPDKHISTFDTPSVPPTNRLSQTLLMPPPLKVRKSQEALNSPDPPLNLNQISSGSKQAPNPKASSSRARRPPPLPIQIKPAETTPPAESELHAPISRDSQHAAIVTSPITSPRGASIRRYNGSLRFLRVQITNSIASLRQLIAEVTELQDSRRAAKNFRRSSSFWTFSPVKSPVRGGEKVRSGGLGKASTSTSTLTLTMETKEQRIARLRADGWKTVGLRNPESKWKGTEYYKRYCGAVLDELYLGS